MHLIEVRPPFGLRRGMQQIFSDCMICAHDEAESVCESNVVSFRFPPCFFETAHYICRGSIGIMDVFGAMMKVEELACLANSAK